MLKCDPPQPAHLLRLDTLVASRGTSGSPKSSKSPYGQFSSSGDLDSLRSGESFEGSAYLDNFGNHNKITTEDASDILDRKIIVNLSPAENAVLLQQDVLKGNPYLTTEDRVALIYTIQVPLLR